MTMLDISDRTRRPVGPELRRAYRTTGAVAVAVAPEPAPAPRQRPEARPNHLRVVAPVERVRRGLTPTMAVLLTAGLFATLLAVAVAHTVLVQGQLRLDELDQQLTEAQARYQELRKEVAELESPPRIVEAARQQGMVTPDDLVYLQPTAPDPSTVGPASGDEHEPAADPTVGSDPGRAWAEVKPMLEAPSP